ncbi:MAG: alpha/beta hydrolase [Patescibacteria group bacterium]|nr:alpha/beta hydrolase [Patescibacteria group bacterium]
MEKIWLTTKDDKKISGLYFPADNPEGWIIYAHMMPATKESWNGLAREMAKRGYAGLAVDLRGHGESEGGPTGYRYFSDAEHQSSINDLETASDFLKENGMVEKKLAIVGASVGANLALVFLAKHQECRTAVLLSPGISYRGIRAIPEVKKISGRSHLLFVCSRDDLGEDGPNPDQVRKIIAALPKETRREEIIYNSAGHGTSMLNSKEDPALGEKIQEFIAGW